MENITLSLAETKVLIDALPATTRNSRAVQGWLESAESWIAKASPAAKLEVAITLDSDNYCRRFRLEIVSSCRYHISLVQVFATLTIPNPGQRIRRRVSLRFDGYLNGARYEYAMQRIRSNIETNLKHA